LQSLCCSAANIGVWSFILEFHASGAAAMMNWNPGKSFANAYAPGPYHLLHPFPERIAPRRSVRAQEKLPDDFPAYLVFVTKHSLLAFTTSLTDVSSDAHSFFVKVNYAFAMERMMRTFMMWAMPGAAAAPTPLNALQSWFSAASPVPQQSPYFDARQLQQLLSPPPAPQHRVTPQDAGQSVAAAYTAMMAFSAACLNAAPAAMDAWRLSAAA
jgi:hypothetical protein